MVEGSGLRVAVIAAGEPEPGGMERLYRVLVDGLAAVGCEVDLVRTPAREGSFAEILANYEAAAALDLSAYDVVISTKAPGYAVRHERHVAYLTHTIRTFDDMFERERPAPGAADFAERKRLHDLDVAGLGGARALFTIAHEVADRLFSRTGLAARVLPQVLGRHAFAPRADGGFLFLPGRLHRWKRVDLAIRAIRDSGLDAELRIAGAGEDAASLRALAAGDRRIRFLGEVSDAELVELYGQCRAVLFVPEREDFGYVTLEAFASGKPVITCTDSGEVTRLVEHGRTGLIVPPNPAAVAAAARRLLDDGAAARAMGLAARQSMADQSGEALVRPLLEAAFAGRQPSPRPIRRVTIADLQPIEPAVAGGRLRLLGLYHALGEDFRATYVGSYDWPGEARRQLDHGDTLTEITVPFSAEHHDAAEEWAREVGLHTVIDISLPALGHLSQDFVDEVRRRAAGADVVVFSHPWVYPLVAEHLKPHQLLVYDAQNVEVFLRRQLLDMRVEGARRLLRMVAAAEYRMVREAHLILACSAIDADRFVRIYGVDRGRIRIVPNGVMAARREVATAGRRAELKQSLGLGSATLALFLGTDFAPNVEAARFVARTLAPQLPQLGFAIVGAAGLAIGADVRSPNLRITGPVPAAELDRWLGAADIALNPVASGSGTNVKLFDFMAAGLPVLTTPTGARGVTAGRPPAFVAADLADFPAELAGLAGDAALRQRVGGAGRARFERDFAAEGISAALGRVLRNWSVGRTPRRPLFSVVVPTYDRHVLLAELLEHLARQVEVDFEVVLVDQSDTPFPRAGENWGFQLTCVRLETRGATRARNVGADIAKGEVLAFTDDDCQPGPDWLVNARRYFSDPACVGVEGLVRSEKLGDPAWRPVSNVGFEGVGFMTANLLVRARDFHAVGGMDEQFDHPHFREDTDLGWRLLERGTIPYGRDVEVFHPAMSRAVPRESHEERVKFFRNDALLANKHPERYRQLFLAEGHYAGTRDFVRELLGGFTHYGIAVPDWLAAFLAERGLVDAAGRPTGQPAPARTA